MIAIGTPLVRETMAMRLKQLEDENRKLKRLVADVMLDRAIEGAIGSSPMARVVLKDLLGKP